MLEGCHRLSVSLSLSKVGSVHVVQDFAQKPLFDPVLPIHVDHFSTAYPNDKNEKKTVVHLFTLVLGGGKIPVILIQSEVRESDQINEPISFIQPFLYENTLC